MHAPESPRTGDAAAPDDEVPAGLTAAEARAYLDARMQGLCHEGALEVAWGSRVTTGAGTRATEGSA